MAPFNQITIQLPPGQHILLLELAEGLLSSQLMGLHCISMQEVNLQPLINTIVMGQQQIQQEQVVACLDKEIKQNTSIALWLGVRTLPISLSTAVLTWSRN